MMRKHKWEAFNPNGPLCELCGVAKDTMFAEGSCSGRVDPKDVEIDELKARVAELETERDGWGNCLMMFRQALAKGLGVPWKDCGLPILIEMACEKLKVPDQSGEGGFDA